MKCENMTKAQLIGELKEMRQRMAELEVSEVKSTPIEKRPVLSDENYQRLFERFPIGITILDMKGVILYCNSAVYSIGDYTEGEFTGKHFSKISPVRLKDIPKFIRVFNSVVRGKIPEQFETIYQRADGTTGWTEITVSLIGVGGKRRILVIQHDITQRKQAEEEVLRLFNAVSISTDGIAMSDMEGKLTYVNEAVLKMYDTDDPNDLLGKSSFELIAPEDQEKALAGMKEVIERGYDKDKEYRIITKSGSEILIEMNTSLVKSQVGESIGFVGIFKDITERKQAEGLLKESEAKFRNLFELAKDAVLLAETETGTIIDANPAACSLLGLPKEKVVGMHQTEIHPPEMVKQYAEIFQEHVRNGKAMTEDVLVQRSDGSLVPVDISASVVELAGKAVIQGVFRDITERKQAEEALRESEESYRALFEHGLDGVFVIDEEMKLLLVNRTATEIFGIDPTEKLLNINMFDYIAPEERERALRIITEDMFSNNLRQVNEFRCIKKSGEEIWVSAIGALTEYRGKKVGLVSFRDITEQKQVEEALLESRRRYLDLVNLLPQTIFETDEKGNLTFANRQGTTAFGHTLEDVQKGLNALEFFIPEDRDKVREGISGVLKGEQEAGTNEYTALRKDGSTFPVIVYSSAIVRENEPVGLRGVILDITERKQVEEMYQTLANSSPVGVYIVQDRKCQFANPQFQKYTGYTEDELLGMDSLDLVHPQDRERVRQNAVDMLKGKRHSSYEFRYISKSGETIWAMETVTPIQYKGKRATLGNFMDITERKQVEEDIRRLLDKQVQSAKEWQETFDSIRDIVTVISPKHEILKINRAGIEALGKKPGEIIGKKCYDLVHGLNAPIEGCPCVESLKTKKSDSGEITERGRHYTVTAWPILDQGREVVAFTHTVTDITERKQAEEALRESRRRFRDMANLLPQIVWETDENGTFTFVNEEGLRTHGYTPEEPGDPTNAIQVFVPEDLERMLENTQRILSGEDVGGIEYTLLRKDGSTFPALVYSTPIIRDGKYKGMRGVTIDITERKRLQEEQQKVDKLESIGTLAGGIAHDFNNILTGILGNITLAKRYVEPKGKAFDRLGEAEKASLKARDLTQQLLTFASGGAPVKKLSSIRELVEDSASFATRGSNVKCVFSLPDDLRTVEIDEGQMSQVINNLVINAVQAMPEGGIINIGARNTAITERSRLPLQKGDYIQITIEDHGIGIPEKHLSRIFEPYYTTKQKGSGLGLATSYSIIKNHDGYMTVNSKLDAGTTFYVYLPASEKPVPKEKKPAAQEPFRGKGRILVMDDDEMIQEMLSDMMRLAGYEMERVSDGAEAIKQYAEAKESGKPFDAVIMDLTIPGGMGGKETIKKLLEIDPQVKAIVSSGYATDPIMADYEEYGFSAVATKPYSVGELEKTLQNILKRRE